MKIRSKKLRDSAEGQKCTLRIASMIFGMRCAGPETTVLCHLPVGGKGMGTKTTDLSAVFGCRTCHDLLDSHDHRITKDPEFAIRLITAITETQAVWLEEGLLKVNDIGAEVLK